MKIVIDIPEGMYEAYKDRPPMFGDEGLDSICQAIANGTPYEERPQGETNADLFKQTFGLYATEVWAMSESQFLKWLNSEDDCKGGKR